MRSPDRDRLQERSSYPGADVPKGRGVWKVAWMWAQAKAAASLQLTAQFG